MRGTINFLAILIFLSISLGCQKIEGIHSKQQLSDPEKRAQIKTFINNPTPSIIEYVSPIVTIQTLKTSGIVVHKKDHAFLFILPTDIFFKPHSDELQETQIYALNNLAKFIKSMHNPNVVITAHTDHIGSAKLKEELSQNQAERIKGFLWSSGIPQHKIAAKGVGDHNPIAEKNYEGSSFNRRIIIHVTKD